MEANKQGIDGQITYLLRKLDCCVHSLYMCPDPYTWSISIKQIRDQLVTLRQEIAIQQKELASLQHTKANFTLEELAKYNGRDGQPAYVAVNGIVYDVTNNATWAAATHFGLVAGNDLTKAFANCHANQQILKQLSVVGQIV